jgi:hypothetical protein
VSKTLSVEQILALSPDSSSAKAAMKLTTPHTWPSLGSSATALWGECQGSGKSPYQTQIDLAEPAFKCSCPSRKFPCKHGLALFLMFVQKQEAFSQTKPPSWVSDWLESRTKRAQAKVEKPAESKQTDEAAQAKRVAAREAKVRRGLQELGLWLHDVARGGLASLQSKPPSFYEEVAARLVDAQAPGVARLVRALADVSPARVDWAEQVLAQLGRIHLLMQGYENLPNLPGAVQDDIRAAIGWTVDQAALLASPGVQDTWWVRGQVTEQDDRLRARRTWLQGVTTRQNALVLDFAHGTQPFTTAYPVESSFAGEIVFFPSNHPQRALVKCQRVLREDGQDLMPTGYCRHADALDAYACAIGAHPWLERFPMPLMNVLPVRTGERWVLRDTDGRLLELASRPDEAWQLLAVSGGQPVHVFAEWDGTALKPLTVRYSVRHHHAQRQDWLVLDSKGNGA